MAERKSARKPAPTSIKRTRAQSDRAKGFTDEERAAMREHAEEVRAARRGRVADPGDESAVLAKIAAMAPVDRVMAERLHKLIRTIAPTLTPRLWYGMPAYAKDGKVLCFFQGAQRFKTRYGTLGFSDTALLDDGHMWPTSFALQELTPVEEARIGALVRRAVGG